jgi:hypothetical protein
MAVFGGTGEPRKNHDGQKISDRGDDTGREIKQARGVKHAA